MPESNIGHQFLDGLVIFSGNRKTKILLLHMEKRKGGTSGNADIQEN